MEDKRHKRGDVREDGMVFWCYEKRVKSGEYWMPREQFDAARKRATEFATSYNKAYYEENREHIIEQVRTYASGNRETIAIKSAAYYAANREAMREAGAAYYALNKDARIKYNIEYEKKRKAVDPLYALTRRLRRRVRGSLVGGGYSKKSKTAEIVGCSFEDFKIHFESLFTDGMSWERFSEIHIDHIIPVSSATNEEELIKLNHYTNLQPLWAKDNLQKSNKILPAQ